MFELILSRVADFHIDFRNSYLALPITFLGLAFGSLHVHFRPSLIERFDVRRALWVLAGISFVTIFIMFILFTQMFGIPAAEGYQSYLGQLFFKTVIFIAVFIAPFYYFGRILTIAYHLNRDQIGLIYSADFFGAALACFLTPVLFHFVSLPEVITALLIGLSLLVWSFTRANWFLRILLAAALIAGNYGFHAALSRMESGIQYLYHAMEQNPPRLTEVLSRWNEFSRVQLVRFEPQNKALPGGYAPPFYRIIHDNARSTVHVDPYDAERAAKGVKARRLDSMELPFLLGRDPKNILVMFAGCGSEMIQLNEYAAGKADVTGVEINPACRDIALAGEKLAKARLADNDPNNDTDKPLASLNLEQFYAQPNIHLEIAEGRSFLEQNTKKFDMIFVGSSAPTALAFTGDTRKYMYTEQAMKEYIAALNPGGMLLFDHQPTETTRETLKAVFAEQGRTDFENCIMFLRSNNGRPSGSPDLIFSPTGFQQGDVEKMLAASTNAKQMLLYAPGYAGNNATVARAIKADIAPEKRVIDDRPYLLRIEFDGYKLFPSKEQLKDYLYFAGWMRVTSLIVLCGLATIFILITAAAPGRRLPPSVLLFLLLTGFCYLVVEVVLIAKLELFLQEPLISMACVVSVLLIASGIGSMSYQKVALRMGVAWFTLFAAAVVFVDFNLLKLVIYMCMGLPLIARLIIAVVVIVPIGVVLGMFYPCAVNALVKGGRESAVPVTYGISTLASVIGATYAMTMMIQIGFTALIIEAVSVYVITAGLLIAIRSVRGEKALL